MLAKFLKKTLGLLNYQRWVLEFLGKIGALKITSAVLKGRNTRNFSSTSTGNNFWEFSGIFKENLSVHTIRTKI